MRQCTWQERRTLSPAPVPRSSDADRKTNGARRCDFNELLKTRHAKPKTNINLLDAGLRLHYGCLMQQQHQQQLRAQGNRANNAAISIIFMQALAGSHPIPFHPISIPMAIPIPIPRPSPRSPLPTTQPQQLSVGHEPG